MSDKPGPKLLCVYEATSFRECLCRSSYYLEKRLAARPQKESGWRNGMGSIFGQRRSKTSNTRTLAQDPTTFDN